MNPLTTLNNELDMFGHGLEDIPLYDEKPYEFSESAIIEINDCYYNVKHTPYLNGDGYSIEGFKNKLQQNRTTINNDNIEQIYDSYVNEIEKLNNKINNQLNIGNNNKRKYH